MSEVNIFLPAGTLLHGGQYRIESHVASGGFGNTYLATDVNLKAKVAIKEFFIKTINHREDDSCTVSVSNSANEEMFNSLRDKFKKEAQRIFKIQHNNVVRVFALFEEYGTVYYSMDYIDGESLNSRIKREGALPESLVRSVFSQMLDALDVVHSTGLLHLDIKPHNIMLTPDGVAKLIDFGASKHANQAEATTITGFAFTPEYAPPELTNQEYDEIGPWTDIYSLGITLYRLLSGAAIPSKREIRVKGAEAFTYSRPVSDAMKQLIVSMTQGASERRPQSIAQLRALANQLGLSEDVTPQATNEETVAKPTPKPVAKPQPKPVQKPKPQPQLAPLISSEETKADNIQKPKSKQKTESKPQHKKDSSKEKPTPAISSEETQVDNKQKPQPEPQPESKLKSNKKFIYIGAGVAFALIAIIVCIFLFSDDTVNKELYNSEVSKSKLIKVKGSREFEVKGIKFTMVPVEGGTFTMGSLNGDNKAQPVHQVTLSSYYIGQTEVTQELWKAVMGRNLSWNKGNKRPMHGISWNDCQEFIRKLNELTGEKFRLPTEAEWEYAARGGNKKTVSNDESWNLDNSEDETHVVAVMSPNGLGIYDMTGNVEEWCQDWYGAYSSEDQTNPQGPTSGSERVLRGGCYSISFSRYNDVERNSSSPTLKGNISIGMRLAL